MKEKPLNQNCVSKLLTGIRFQNPVRKTVKIESSSTVVHLGLFLEFKLKILNV